MKRAEKQWFLMIVLASILILGLGGCAEKEQPASEEPAAEEMAPAPGESEEAIFTMTDPGPWEGKEKAHVPVIMYEKTDSGLDVSVTVNHEMNPETPHYIMWIRLEDADGNILGEKSLTAESEKAEANFSLAVVPGHLKALEKCNLHGIWAAETAVILE